MKTIISTFILLLYCCVFPLVTHAECGQTITYSQPHDGIIKKSTVEYKDCSNNSHSEDVSSGKTISNVNGQEEVVVSLYHYTSGWFPVARLNRTIKIKPEINGAIDCSAYNNATNARCICRFSATTNC